MTHNEAYILLKNLRARMDKRLTSGEKDALDHAVYIVKKAIK